jgi:hypothetical protein
MSGIPPSRDTDPEDVTWALQTAEALWKRSEWADALVWLRRAARAAGDAQHDDRALELAHDAAELAEGITEQQEGEWRNDELEARTTQTDEVEEISIEVAMDSAPILPPDSLDTPPRGADRVLSAAEKHAGILDPWAEGEGRSSDAVCDDSSGESLPRASERDGEDLVTSAPEIPRARPVPASASTPPEDLPLALAASESRGGVLDLSLVDALGDLPDDARYAFASAADIRVLSREEEVSGFALALILEGRVELAATIVDTPAQTLAKGRVIRARGTIEHVVPMRLISASDGARVATWDEASVAEAFRACPWVEDDLRAASDHLQALVGVTMGPLGERLDPSLRAQVIGRLALRVLAEREVLAARGKPVPGLLVVGGGEIDLVDDRGAPEGPSLGAGDFLFPQEVLRAGPAPSTARAAKGGALVLFADRRVAQELLVTCPPLLEIFAGM